MIGKHGSILDIFFILLFITVAAIGITVAFVLNTSIFGTNPATNTTNPLTNSTVSRSIAGNGLTSLQILDDAIIILYFAMNLAAVITGAMVKTHPILFIVVFFVLLIFLLLANVFTDVFQQIVTSQQIVPVANAYLGTLITLFKYLPIFTILFGFLIGIFQNSAPAQPF